MSKCPSVWTQESRVRDFIRFVASGLTLLAIKGAVALNKMDPFTDGYELPNHGRQSVFPNGSLVIENAHKLHDEGFYTCTAFNPHDESHSGTVQIEVLSK